MYIYIHLVILYRFQPTITIVLPRTRICRLGINTIAHMLEMR